MSATGQGPAIRRLQLQDFRSYPTLDLAVPARLVALTGENGAGKTNILEAVSLFAQGRGLRRADFAEMTRIGGGGGFAVSAVLDTPTGEVRIGTGMEPSPDGALQRRCRIDRATVGSAAAFSAHLRIVWLTPAFDGLFTGAAGDRRRFLDRLVLAVDAGHASRVSSLERALRSRNRLLDDPGSDPAWLDAVEREVAETGVAVAAARQETVARLAALIAGERDDASPFPWAGVSLSGALDEDLASRPAVDVEDRFRRQLRDGRSRDRAAGRTMAGPQTSDLLVTHGPKGIPSSQASTGEQKALLVGLVLAHARLVAAMTGIVPLVLLDEVAAHLDPRRRAALFGVLDAMGGQVWMTGADPGGFTTLPGDAALYEVTPGHVEAIQRA